MSARTARIIAHRILGPADIVRLPSVTATLRHEPSSSDYRPIEVAVSRGGRISILMAQVKEWDGSRYGAGPGVNGSIQPEVHLDRDHDRHRLAVLQGGFE